jgi:tetratricopeptide (TPR) repeat protein
VDRPHELQRHPRDVIVPGRLEAAPGDGPAADRTGPAVAVAPGQSAVDLTAVKDAMDRREFDRATDLLDRALDTHPDAPEALALMGRVLECRGLDHSAYHEYRRALAVDPDNLDARAGMRRYCARFGLDADDARINPAAGR